MKNNKLFACLALLAFVCIPSVSEAYFTTEQSVTTINEQTAIYAITYKFGFENREVYMPIFAQRGIQAGEDRILAGYDLLSNGEKTEAGFANGIILTKDANVQVKDGRYYLPAGQAASFTLYVIAAPTVGHSLLMTNLPFEMIKGGAHIPAYLNPSELQYYQTPEIE